MNDYALYKSKIDDDIDIGMVLTRNHVNVSVIDRIIDPALMDADYISHCCEDDQQSWSRLRGVHAFECSFQCLFGLRLSHILSACLVAGSSIDIPALAQVGRFPTRMLHDDDAS